MQRFPLYEDIKDLNNKFLPELAKMEQHVANFQLELEQTKAIVRRFDEIIANKSGKEHIDLLHEKINKECAQKNELESFQNYMNQENYNNQQTFEKHQAKFDSMNRVLQDKIDRSVMIATQHLQGSALD